MRRVLLAIILTIGLAAPVLADFQAGLDAYKRGDYAVTLKEWQPLAEAGYAYAQFNLGLLHAKGHGVPQDYSKALVWYRKAAGQGSARAQSAIGFYYERGLGIPQDYAQALAWYRKAAKGGYKFASKEVARLEGDPKISGRADPLKRLPPHRLALHLLGTARLAHGLIGQANANINRDKVDFRLLIGPLAGPRGMPKHAFDVFNIDGTKGTVEPATLEEFEQFLSLNRLLHETYKKAIMRRGFKKLAKSYDARVSPGCSKRWFSPGEVVVKQNDIIFEVSQDGDDFWAVVVEDTIALAIPELVIDKHDVPPVIGTYGKNIELKDTGSKCKIILTPK